MAERLLHVYNHVPTMQPKKEVHDMITKVYIKRVSITDDDSRLSNTFQGNGDDSITAKIYNRLSNTFQENGDDPIAPITNLYDRNTMGTNTVLGIRNGDD
eukprot:298055_1